MMKTLRTAWMAVWAGLMAVTAGIGACADDMAPVAVMSFNVRYGRAADGLDDWQHRQGLLTDTVAKAVPDLLGLQEALDFQIAAIRKAVPGYGQIGLGRDGGTTGEFSAILYRESRFEALEDGTFWLSDTPEVPSATWGNHFRRIVTWAHLRDRASGRDFYYYNTHFDHESEQARVKSAALLLDRMKARAAGHPLILTGDFNDVPTSPALQALVGAGLTDSYAGLHPDLKDSGTFHAFTGKRDGNRIDYIFLLGGFVATVADIDHTVKDGHYPSDHFPVTARLRLDMDGAGRAGR